MYLAFDLDDDDDDFEWTHSIYLSQIVGYTLSNGNHLYY